MPDITMCSNTRCNLQEHCWRAKAEPKDFMQAYSWFEYTLVGWMRTSDDRHVRDVDCQHYWPLDD